MGSEGIHEVPSIAVGSDEELLRTLDATPLTSWKDKTDALSSRFASAKARAAKYLEPKLQRLRLSSGTLKTPDDVKTWLTEQEAVITEKLKDGPVVID